MSNVFSGNKNKLLKNYSIWIHALVWIVLICMPLLLLPGNIFVFKVVLEHSWIPLIYYAIIFYLNYFLLIDKLFFNKKNAYFLTINILLFVIFIGFNHVVKPVIFNHFEYDSPRHGPPHKFVIYFDLVFMVVPFLLALAIKTSERWRKITNANAESANVKLQAELQHLKYQVQPHFFFNSLNNIYSLVDVSPIKAKETIHSLSKLMRYLLYQTDAPKVSLNNEISFMQRYIDLMKLRTSENTIVTSSFATCDNDIMVPPLLFISLIENAFKHGIDPRQKSCIDIKLTITGKIITFETRNPFIEKQSPDLSGSAIGVENIKRRLGLLFPAKHTFTTTIVNNVYIACLIIDTN